MISYIRIRSSDFSDGIPASAIPSGPTTQSVSPAKFVSTTEFSRLRFTCTGTTFSLQIARDSTSVINAVYNDCAVYVDGAYAGKITPTLNVVAWYTFTMSNGGLHVVEFQCGQGGLNAPGYMTCGHVLAISGTNLAVAKAVAARKLWIFGDSIVCANGGTDPGPGVSDFYSLIRANYPGRVTGDAMGTAGYNNWSNNTWLVERIKRHTAGATKVDLLCQMGVNDYQGWAGGSSLTPILTPMFTAFAAGVPNLNKFVVMTPISRITEGVNGNGFTLGDVRNQIAAAANAVGSPKITVVDGSTFGINTSTELYDGVHPNALGAAKMFTGVRGALGI